MYDTIYMYLQYLSIMVSFTAINYIFIYLFLTFFTNLKKFKWKALNWPFFNSNTLSKSDRSCNFNYFLKIFAVHLIISRRTHMSRRRQVKKHYWSIFLPMGFYLFFTSEGVNLQANISHYSTFLISFSFNCILITLCEKGFNPLNLVLRKMKNFALFKILH